MKIYDENRRIEITKIKSSYCKSRFLDIRIVNYINDGNYVTNFTLNETEVSQLADLIKDFYND